MYRRFWLLVAVVLVAVGPARAGAAPRVVVSILPLHALVAAVMEGVAAPDLLVPAGASAHSFSLRPSDARALAGADLVVWVGPSLEGFLVKPLRALASGTPRLTLSEAPELEHLPARRGGDWHGDPSPAAHAGGSDPHLWLSPANARAIVSLVAARLASLDASNAARYRANAEATRARLRELEARLNRRLRPVKDTPFVVLHDAYQYFEAALGLNSVAALTVNPGVKPGARRLKALRERMQASGARCVVSQPQASPALARALLEDTDARQATLDPLGADLASGPDAYFALLEHMAKALRQCLRPEGSE